MTKELKEHIMVGEAINEWQGHYLTEVRNLSGNAIRAYRNGLGLFLDYLESVKGVRRETLVGDCFRVDTIEDWLAWMKEAKGCSPSTCNLRLASLRSFIAFLARKNVAFIKYGCIITSVKRLRPAKKLPEVISRETIKVLFASMDTGSMTGKRDFALFNVMYSTATRVDEVLSLKIADVALGSKSPCIKVTGKGSKLRCIYLLKSVAKIIGHYISVFHGNAPVPSDFLFFPINGRRNTKLCQEAVSKRLKLYASKSPMIPDSFHCHSLRHARATHWLEDGVNIVQIQRLLGHEGIETTMRYVGISKEQMIKALAVMDDATTKNIEKHYKSPKVKKSLAAVFGLK